MPTRLFLLCFLLVNSHTLLARGPAVEDFVGVEVEENHRTPHGAELLYNLERDVSLIAKIDVPETKTATSQSYQNKAWSTSAVFTLVTLLGLPLLIWSGLMSYFRKKSAEEHASNIEILENYRKQKESSAETKEENRKVS